MSGVRKRKKLKKSQPFYLYASLSYIEIPPYSLLLSCLIECKGGYACFTGTPVRLIQSLNTSTIRQEHI